jgi:AcrR family transcriptional regulator
LKTPQDNAQDKRNQILSATTKLLRKQGVQALSFEGIAAEAGLSRQLVRYYFSDIDALIVKLCDHLGASYRDILVEGIVEVAEVKRLDFFLDFFFGLLEDRPMPENLEVYDVFFAHAINSEPLRERLCAQYKTLGDVVIHELAIAYPELDGHSCEELSFLFVTMMHAHWSFVATLQYSPKHGFLARQAFDRLIASYVGDSKPTRAMERPWQ